jgi:multicomponent Na+:H+ antiporter subunit A
VTPVLLLFGMSGLLLVAFGARLGRRAFLVGAVAPAVATAWLVAHLPGVTDGRSVTEGVAWVPELGLSLDLRLDGLAMTMSLVVAGIGVLVLVYAAAYFRPGTPDLGRLAGLLVLFAGAMLGLVQADHLLLLYTFWELTSVASYLLIGNRHGDPTARAAALQALLTTGAGGLAMLAGFVLLGQEAGTYRLSELAQGPAPSGGTATAAAVLVLLGALTKSAQYPFSAWLPAAMTAPTPVSAYLHSATMVKAGVYLVARLAPVLAVVDGWRPVVVTAGLVTLVLGGLRALRQSDLKLLLAFGTVSQLGLMVVLFGVGLPADSAAGWTLLVGHALFKGALFLVVGALDRATGTRDRQELPALGRSWRPVEVVSLVSALSMAGVPLVAGFVAKESAYDALEAGGFPGNDLVLAVVVLGSMVTVAYAARFHWGAFVTARRERRPAFPAAPDPALWVPAAVLAAGTLVLGIAPGIEDPLVSASLAGLFPGVDPVHLELWHGFGVPLLLSATTLLGGLLLFLGDRPVQAVLAVGRAVPDGSAVYLAGLRSLAAGARRVTGVVQSGSLPVYAGVILATAAVLPAGALLLSSSAWPGWPRFGPLRDVPIASLLLLAAIGAAGVRRRFSAAIFLGTAGYAMAALFVVDGAPDLALTQAAVETLSTVVFVLVLQRLPERFERQSSPRRRSMRVAIAGLVGGTVFVLAIVAAGGRTALPVSDEMIARAVPDGHGANVVNVILVDFRGLDTLGEITVLAVASIGAVAVARAGRRVAEKRGRARTPPGIAEVRRIVFVDVTAAVIFHVLVMTSLWLLFAGHNQPGGGFVGGLLAGSAITLRYIAGGMTEVRGLSRFRPWTVLGTGLLLAAGTAAAPLLAGGAVLDIAIASITLPVIGETEVSSALVFDIGVYVTVVGMVLMAFEAFGDEPAEAVP